MLLDKTGVTRKCFSLFWSLSILIKAGKASSFVALSCNPPYKRESKSWAQKLGKTTKSPSFMISLYFLFVSSDLLIPFTIVMQTFFFMYVYLHYLGAHIEKH